MILHPPVLAGGFLFLPGYFPADFDLIKICRCQAAVGGAFDICFTGKGDAAGAGAVRLFFGFEQELQNSLANPGFVFDGYEVEAVGYLMKPVDSGQLISLLNRISEKKGKEKRYLIFRDSGEDYRLEEQDLLYLESDGHYIRIHGTKEEYEVKGKFQDMIRVLVCTTARCLWKNGTTDNMSSS